MTTLSEFWTYLGFFESLYQTIWSMNVNDVEVQSPKWSIFWSPEIIEGPVQ